MSENTRRESLAAIQRSSAVLAETRREQKRIRETLRQSKQLDRSKKGLLGRVVSK